MNWPYLHLITNHFPIILGVVGAAGAFAGQLTGRDGLLRYGAICLVLGGLAAPVAYLTGLRAEEAVEELWYAAEAAIEAHEELGLWALIAAVTSGAVSFAWLRCGGRLLGGIATALGVAAALVLGITALRGGRIIHESPALEVAAPPLRTP